MTHLIVHRTPTGKETVLKRLRRNLRLMTKQQIASLVNLTAEKAFARPVHTDGKDAPHPELLEGLRFLQVDGFRPDGANPFSWRGVVGLKEETDA